MQTIVINGTNTHIRKPSSARVSREQKYHQAAIAYLVYGFIYLGGAVYLAEVGVVARSGLVWFLVGAAFIVVLPPLIWKGFKWFTRVLALLVGVRVAGLIRVIITDDGTTVPLPWGGGLPLVAGAVVFLLIAAFTCYMLIRAGWAAERNDAESTKDE